MTSCVSTEEAPKTDNSLVQPDVMLVVIAARVALLQGAAEQRFVSQPLIGAMIDEFSEVVTIEIKDERLKHEAASGFVATAVNA